MVETYAWFNEALVRRTDKPQRFLDEPVRDAVRGKDNGP